MTAPCILRQILPSSLRVCLRCNKSFPSIGPGNRICEDCKRKNNKLGINTTSASVDGRVYRNAPQE